jgi:hypothetical protein
MSENSLKRKEKKGKIRSFEVEEFGKVFIIFEAKTKKGNWYRKGRIRIK